MKIVVLDGYTENPGDISWGEMEKLGELTVYDRTPAELTQMRIGDAELVITNKTAITADILLHCPNVKYIGVLATGYNVINTAAAKERSIPVCNIPTYGTTAVAQYVMALLLEICHHVADHSASVKNGDWSACADFCYWNYPLMELAGKTLGIIGFGRIGQATAKLAAAFGMKILAYDEHPNETGRLYGTYVSLDQLYAESDVISLHCPLFPSTEGLINKKSIARMKDGVILINTSRGPLIVEQDLADALNSKKVAYAACDVVSAEPIRPDNPLLGCYHSIITPHIAWAPKESRQRLMDIAVSNVKAFLCGTPENRVNL
ncbi:D-2-hydroxyacid dehydrogenase [Lachnospiraceae bacterium 54-53]